jgi:hypothetical protein
MAFGEYKAMDNATHVVLHVATVVVVYVRENTDYHSGKSKNIRTKERRMELI